MNEISVLNRAADNIRILTAAMVEKAKSGHPGGSMGGADFINVLYSEFLVYDPENPEWENRDRFFLDPGHMSPMLYSVLAMAGKYSMDDLKNFRQWGSVTPGHPELDVKRGIENSSGPLGQGHAMAVGAAIAERFMASRFGEWTAHKTYTYISDGGIQEEVSQGVGRIAGTLGLSNLIMFFDANNVQLSTYVDEVTTEDTAKKYEAWGWNVLTINGNDAGEIRQALMAAPLWKYFAAYYWQDAHGQGSRWQRWGKLRKHGFYPRTAVEQGRGGRGCHHTQFGRGCRRSFPNISRSTEDVRRTQGRIEKNSCQTQG